MKRLSLVLICAASAFGLSFAASALAKERWPDLPLGFKHGVSARVDDVVYVGLGSLDDRLYSLNVANGQQQWMNEANFPGPPRHQALAVAVGDSIFVMGGIGYEQPADTAAVVLDDVYRYDTRTHQWQQLETTTPAGFVGVNGYALNDRDIAIFGGYQKPIIDDYLAKLARINPAIEPERFQQLVNEFMSLPVEYYGASHAVHVFNTHTNQWSTKPNAPFAHHINAALVGRGNELVLISGGVKPGLASEQVHHATFKAGSERWQSLTALPAQEGLSGAFAGLLANDIVVAGGANFEGALRRAMQGKSYAHDGLSRTRHRTIYRYQHPTWRQATAQLPEGLAFGASFSLDDGLLMVGGEGWDGVARRQVSLIKHRNGDLVIEP